MGRWCISTTHSTTERIARGSMATQQYHYSQQHNIEHYQRMKPYLMFNTPHTVASATMSKPSTITSMSSFDSTAHGVYVPSQGGWTMTTNASSTSFVPNQFAKDLTTTSENMQLSLELAGVQAYDQVYECECALKHRAWVKGRFG
jgi:hypothetical protein